MKILNPMPPYNLFGLEDADYEKSKVVVLPVPYDSTTSYKAGTRDGPHAIVEASRNIEYYSEELDRNIRDVGIYTLDELAPTYSSASAMSDSIEAEIRKLLEDSKLPLVLGGEHSVSIGAIRAVAKREKEFSVLQFDAHSDYRNEYMGSKYSHACVMARALESSGSCYGVGIRSTDDECGRKYAKNMLYRKDMHDMSINEIINTIDKKTRKKIYITIDVDVLDPGQMPSVGTPEPDGLTFHELTTILREILKRKELLAIDFNELSPIPGMVAPNYLIAKLIYLTIGYNFYTFC